MTPKASAVIRIQLEKKEAKKVLAALEKGVYSKLTKAQADSIAEFIFNFRCELMEA